MSFFFPFPYTCHFSLFAKRQLCIDLITATQLRATLSDAFITHVFVSSWEFNLSLIYHYTSLMPVLAAIKLHATLARILMRQKVHPIN